MDQTILVSYVSGSGSTREVANFIGQELAGADTSVEIRPASEVRDLAAYSAVVLGSSVRFGRWLPDAIDFLDGFADALVDLPVAFFMTCLTIVEGEDQARETALAYWDPILQRVPNVEPVGLGLFAGSLAPALGQLPEYQGPYGDYRDWDAIRSWVHEIGPALRSGKPRASAPLKLSGTILKYTDFSGYDLSRIDFQDSDLLGARMRDTNLEEADLTRANMRSADLRGADLNEARLGWADLRETQCQGADFSHANLMGVRLDNADLFGAKFAYAVLNGAVLTNANLQQADLRNADLNWADLRGADLTGANLAQANLGWANLVDATLFDADLQGARHNSQTKWPLDFSPGDAGCILVEDVHK